MQVYLSSSSNHRFFVDSFLSVVNDLRSSHSLTALEPIYPPDRVGGDLGKVLSNILRIRDAKLVIFNVTPERGTSPGDAVYNPGVMIEYGIVLALENPAGGYPDWGGVRPRPSYKVFCDKRFPRSNLTPIFNQASVIPFDDDPNSSDFLPSLLKQVLMERVTETLNFTSVVPLTDQTGGIRVIHE